MIMEGKRVKKREAIEQALLNMINCGAFAPGDKLPSIRDIARNFHCSITPVTEAYNNLCAMHAVENRPCSGFYVSRQYHSSNELYRHNKIKRNDVEKYDSLEQIFPGYGTNTMDMGNTIDTAFAASAAGGSWYPIYDVNAYIGNVFRTPDMKNKNLQVKIHDVVELRYEIMHWMLPCHCMVTIDELSIVSSVSLAIILALRTVAKPGETIAVEAPGFTGFYFAAQFLNYRVLPVRSDPISGLDIKEFISVLDSGERPACLLLTANFSNPTGALMPDENKQALTRLCAERQIPIIEDDCLGPLFYSRSRPKPLKHYDENNVIYISGFGKTISPDIRLAWVAPGKYGNQFALQKHLTVAYVNTAIQSGMAEFLNALNPYDYMNTLKKKVKQAMQEQVDIINEFFPLYSPMEMPKGGIYLWVPLDKNMNAKYLAERSAALGISISPYNLFNAPPDMHNCFRINSIAVPWNAKSRDALRKLGQLASAMARE